MAYGDQALTYIFEEIFNKTPNPTIFEFGACDGYHTKVLLSRCHGVPNYFVFEPDPRNVARYQSGADRRAKFFPWAIGHVDEVIDFNLSTPEPGGATGCSSLSGFKDCSRPEVGGWAWLKVQETIKVQCRTLDGFCTEHGVNHIDFIWMDIQGAERLMIRGAQEMLKKTRYLYTEYDGGTLYDDSSSYTQILGMLPGWEPLIDLGGDVLLKNCSYP